MNPSSARRVAIHATCVRLGEQESHNHTLSQSSPTGSAGPIGLPPGQSEATTPTSQQYYDSAAAAAAAAAYTNAALVSIEARYVYPSC